MWSIGLRDIRLGDKLDGNYDKIDKDENDVDAELLCCILYACMRRTRQWQDNVCGGFTARESGRGDGNDGNDSWAPKGIVT